MRLPVVVLILVLALAACDSSSEADVLSGWIDAAFVGDVDAAGEFLADDVEWIGLGESPDVFAEGSRPFASQIESIECNDNTLIPTCDAVWTDRWIEAIPGLGRGSIRVTGEIRDGQIVAFRQWRFAPELIQAFNAHIRWLAQTQPEEFAQACEDDPGASTCSTLLVNTVRAWIDASP
jgi:hypothetical protein